MPFVFTFTIICSTGKGGYIFFLFTGHLNVFHTFIQAYIINQLTGSMQQTSCSQQLDCNHIPHWSHPGQHRYLVKRITLPGRKVGWGKRNSKRYEANLSETSHWLADASFTTACCGYQLVMMLNTTAWPVNRQLWPSVIVPGPGFYASERVVIYAFSSLNDRGN